MIHAKRKQTPWISMNNAKYLSFSLYEKLFGTTESGHVIQNSRRFSHWPIVYTLEKFIHTNLETRRLANHTVTVVWNEKVCFHCLCITEWDMLSMTIAHMVIFFYFPILRHFRVCLLAMCVVVSTLISANIGSRSILDNMMTEAN